MTLRKIAIIANGEEPRTLEEREALRLCQGCVCCDRLPPKDAPTLLQIVGDMDSCYDSIPPQLLTDLHDDQETNDLTKAMRWVQRKYPDASWTFFGVTGKREDHTLANLALIYESGREATIFTSTGRFLLVQPTDGPRQLPILPCTPISFLSLTPQTVSVSNVQWPVEQLSLQSLWRATLNRTLDAPFVTLHVQAPLYIYQPYQRPSI